MAAYRITKQTFQSLLSKNTNEFRIYKYN
jgi:hypothetical protein